MQELSPGTRRLNLPPACNDERPVMHGSRAAAFRAVSRQPGLRRIEIGWAGVVTGESIAQIAIGVPCASRAREPQATAPDRRYRKA
jgi:hypothetical protein